MQTIIVILLLSTAVIDQSAMTTRDEVAGWTWTENIVPGSYSWNVSIFKYQNQTIDTKIEENDLIEGSTIELTVAETLFGIDYLNQDEVASLPITVKFDQMEVDKGDFYPIEFIYPALVEWKNGTYDNVFLLDIPEFRDVLDFSNYSSIEGENYIIDDPTNERKLYIIRQITTGLLMEWRVELLYSVIEYKYLGFNPLLPSEENQVEFTLNIVLFATTTSFFIILSLFFITRKIRNLT